MNRNFFLDFPDFFGVISFFNIDFGVLGVEDVCFMMEFGVEFSVFLLRSCASISSSCANEIFA